MSNQNEERQKKIEQTCIMCIREIITSCFNEMNNHNATLLVEPQNIRRVLDIVFSAQPNYDRKDFPDFITDKAFIEHFKVSSSPIMGNNGSEYYKNKKQHDKSVDDFFHNAKSGSSKVVELENKNHSYENLESSFKISWDKHIKKPEINTLYASYTKVFLVEYTEMELQNTTDGSWFKLRKDKNLLEYINKTKGFDYIIFRNMQYVEILDSINVERLLNNHLEQLEYNNINGGMIEIGISENITPIQLDSIIL